MEYVYISHYRKSSGVGRIRLICKACRSISDKVYWAQILVKEFIKLFPRPRLEKKVLLRRTAEVRILANTVVTNMFVSTFS